MKPMRILTVDDEVLALRRLRLLLQTFPDIDHVGEADGREEALTLIERFRPDILLLDIKMRDGTGFDVIDELRGPGLPAVIFVSAFSHFATKAFDKSAVDYVLKPVESSRLAAAIERARSRLAADEAGAQIAELKEVVATLRANIEENGETRFETEFWIRDHASGFVRVPVDSVELITSEDDYVRLHTRERSYLMRSSIAAFESRIDPNHFTRIHRKTLVRHSSIQEMRRLRSGAYEAVIQNGQRYRVGRIYAKKFKGKISSRRPPQ